MRQQILGIDYGRQKIGVAIADLSAYVVTPLAVVTGTPRHFIDQISELVRWYHVARIVVGMPYHQDGRPSALGEEIQKFVVALRDKLAIPVVLQDERLTTQAAKKQLRETKISGRADDALAAAQILQSYLDRVSAGTFI